MICWNKSIEQILFIDKREIISGKTLNKARPRWRKDNSSKKCCAILEIGVWEWNKHRAISLI